MLEAGGVIFSPGEQTRLTFSWRLGTTTNNQVEAYALYQGLILAQSQCIESISVLGDLKGVISHVRKKKISTDMKLINIFTINFKELEAFHSFFPFHILRHKNSNVDFQANIVIQD